MDFISHQTAKLKEGNHGSPTDGACAMEMASMLAGEQFTDRPRSVSRVIGSFVRTYNDRIDEARRRDLLAHASTLVGSARTSRIEVMRMDRLLRFGDEQLRSWQFGGLRKSLRWRAVGRMRRRDLEHPGIYAANAIEELTDQSHSHVLALLAELVALGGPVSFVSPHEYPELRDSFRPEVVAAWLAADPACAPLDQGGEQARIGRGDAVHAEAPQRVDRSALVDGPRV